MCAYERSPRKILFASNSLGGEERLCVHKACSFPQQRNFTSRIMVWEVGMETNEFSMGGLRLHRLTEVTDRVRFCFGEVEPHTFATLSPSLSVYSAMMSQGICLESFCTMDHGLLLQIRTLRTRPLASLTFRQSTGEWHRSILGLTLFTEIRSESYSD